MVNSLSRAIGAAGRDPQLVALLGGGRRLAVDGHGVDLQADEVEREGGEVGGRDGVDGGDAREGAGPGGVDVEGEVVVLDVVAGGSRATGSTGRPPSPRRRRARAAGSWWSTSVDVEVGDGSDPASGASSSPQAGKRRRRRPARR